MNAKDLIDKYIDGQLSDSGLSELRALLKKDKNAVRQLISEIQFSDAVEECFSPDRALDITGLLSRENGGELAEDERSEYMAAGDTPSPELSDEEIGKAAGGGLDSEFARKVRDWLFDIFKRKS